MISDEKLLATQLDVINNYFRLYERNIRTVIVRGPESTPVTYEYRGEHPVVVAVGCCLSNEHFNDICRRRCTS